VVIAQCVSSTIIAGILRYRFCNGYEVRAESTDSNWEIIELTELDKALL